MIQKAQELGPHEYKTLTPKCQSFYISEICPLWDSLQLQEGDHGKRASKTGELQHPIVYKYVNTHTRMGLCVEVVSITNRDSA